MCAGFQDGEEILLEQGGELAEVPGLPSGPQAGAADLFGDD